jgi:hypothetical protein
VVVGELMIRSDGGGEDIGEGEEVFDLISSIDGSVAERERE